MLTPLKSIRVKCLDCVCGSSNEVKLCPAIDCSLFPYRFGRRPAGGKKRVLSEKQKLALKNNYLKMKEAQKAKSKSLPQSIPCSTGTAE